MFYIIYKISLSFKDNIFKCFFKEFNRIKKIILIKSWRLEQDRKIEGSIIKDPQNLFKLEKEIGDTTIKGVIIFLD